MDGTRRQVVTARAEDVDLEPLPSVWRDPDALLLGSVANELFGVPATALDAGCTGAIAQGYVRSIDADGVVSARAWERPARDLLGVHVLFLSEHDLPDADARARELLACVPDRRAHARLARADAAHARQRPRGPDAAAGRGGPDRRRRRVRAPRSSSATRRPATRSTPRRSRACAASCAVEGVGVSSLGSRAEVLRRMAERERLIEDGEWEE